MKRTKVVVSIIAALGVLALAGACGDADLDRGQQQAALSTKNPNPGVLPPWSSAFGKTYGEWSALWWKWALAQPANANPILDPDGGFGAIGQSGHVWFLAGTSGGTAVRSLTVPTGKALFFPILNSIWVTILYLGDDPFTVPGAEEYARAAIAADPAAVMTVTIDGKALTGLTGYRAKSPVFTAYLPDYNLYDPLLNPWGIDITGGTYPDCVADGYWIMLPPLSKGVHSIAFTGADSYGFSLDVTYNLTVQ